MRKLTKNPNDSKLFGVCSGLAQYFNLDVTLVRLLFVFGAIFSGSVLFWIYIILALILPNK